MLITSAVFSSWRSFWTLRKHHDGPAWARVLIASLLALLAWGALCLLGMSGVVAVQVPDPAFLRRLAIGVLLLFQVIALSILALVRLAEWCLPEARLAMLSPVRDWRSAGLVSLLLVAGIMTGNLLGSLVLAWVYPESELFTSSVLGRQLRFLQFLPFLAVVGALVWRVRLQRYALQAQAAEAQLRLLHAQIEPHFLFNTLANIESLLETDTDRARAMLEAFSDHLRAGLTQLRAAETTLGAELDMAANYLRLLQIRMGARLRFSVEADKEARAARLPPLLLQPLVENAIRHGLEPKVDGGCVRVHACVEDGRLRIRVDDDGLGFNEHTESKPSLRAGSGMALANIRARLQHRYGERGRLTLAGAGSGGASAGIELPYRANP
ncbi:sensor histidine kinase [Massilia sp. Leaf139]|uniref:sensor histidine kinase n=1 Tax=Massilia sp. Leaf139 TaxID=1736272 RepID=UPI0006F8A8BF|nr:histidine kinase [Massilia sp. Leaf139]KQQ91792.1 hypothetical protein ASF77_07630 [Massilia sp. Leaf139]